MTNVNVRQHRILRLALLILFFLPGAHRLLAQSGAGSIQGTVKDPSGAVIKGAQIHVVNTATNVAINAKTNGTGFFEVPELLTGRYKLTVTSSGMKTYQTSIELLVAQNAVINPRLEAGEVSQTVEVNADTVQLTTNDGPQVESTLEHQRIEQLPENGRNIQYLIGLAVPGFENGNAANGSDPEAIELVLDGAPTRNNNQGGNPNLRTENIDPDAVQEVRVELNNSGAQYAAPTTAVVATKSGTNKFHGSLFETARNNAFGVATVRNSLPGTPTPQLIRNEFGASVGGPIWIPKVYDGHNKTFFFVAYERYSLAQNSTTRIKVPTMAWRQGNFSGLTNASNVPITLFDPATTTNSAACPYLVSIKAKTTADPFCRTPYPNNVITTPESPLAKVYGDIVPQPNTSDNPSIKGNYIGSTTIYQTVPQITARVDQTFNQSNRMFVRFTHEQSAVNIKGSPTNVAADGIPAGAAFGYNNNPSEHYNGAISYTHVFSPTFFAETVVSSQWFSQATFTGTHADLDYGQILGLPNNFGESGFPDISGQIKELTGSQSGNAHQVQINSLLDENLTKIWGHHQILFGGRISHTRQSNQPNGASDTTTFGANPTALLDPTTISGQTYTAQTATGNADASLYIGSAGSYNVQLQAPRVNYHQWGEALYVQDNFHWRENITLNLGVRYEAHPALWTNDGLMNSFDLKNDAVVLATTTDDLVKRGYTTQSTIDNDKFIGMRFETAQEAGFPANTLLKSYNANFLPRLGIAWTLNHSKWSPILRGGYGMYLNDTPLEDFANHPENQNPLQNTFLTSYSNAAQSVDGFQNELIRYNDPVKFGVAGLNTSGVVSTTFNPNGPLAALPIQPGTQTAQWGDDPNWRPIRYQQANATVELPMPWRSALRVSYIWQKTTNLDLSLAYNNSPSNFQWESQTGTALPIGFTANVATNPYDNTTYGGNTWHTKQGWKLYNGLQMNYQRLFHGGSAWQVSYVFAKAMTAGGDNGGGDADSNVYPRANYPGGIGNAGVVSSPFPFYQGVNDPANQPNQPEYVINHDQIKFQAYQLDTSVPVHHVKFNGIYDLPIGRGKKLFGNSPKWLNEIIGGFQVAGSGSVVSQLFQPGTGQWGIPTGYHLYKKSHPVTDCRSGVCYNTFLWYNGFILPQQNPNDPQFDGSQVPPKVTTTNASLACTYNSTCINGIPSSVVPGQSAIDTLPGDANYSNNKVTVTLLNGKTATLAYDAGPTATNFARKRYFAGPMNWMADASLFKAFPIKGAVVLKVNLDAFNVFNMQGENNPDAQGIENYQAAPFYGPRQLQITMRLNF